jgi:phage terminase large subunit-like protein
MTPWESYAHKVVNGDIVVGKYVRLAVERYYDDLQRVGDEDFPYYFDEKKAQAVVSFFPAALRHSIGEHAGEPFHLEEWQAFAIANIFGWQRADGRGRRFRRIYWSMSRKQGKSTIAAGIAMFVASCDINPVTNAPEGQSQIIMAATKREQSEKVILAECFRMRNQSPVLKEGSTVANKVMTFHHNGGNMQAVGSDRPYDGLNPQLVIMDETHAWTKQHRKFYNTMVTGSGSRVQPLTMTVTTAGDDQSHLWIEEVGFAKAVLDKTVESEQLFAAIYEIDEDDNPFDESCWIKSCPNMGVSISMEFLRGQIKPAHTSPQALNRFKRYHANVLVSSTERIFNLEDYDKCEGELSNWAKDADCVGGGIDLGGRDDLAAAALVARFDTKETDDNGEPVYRYEGRVWAYISSNTPRDLNELPIADFIDQGLIKVTPHPMKDLSDDFVDRFWENYSTDAAVDPYNAQQFAESMEQQGVRVFAMPQTTRHFNEPINELRQAMADGRFTHDGNKLLRWCLGNAVAVRDRSDRWMYDKASSSQKIDPLVALTMAFGRAMMGKGRSDGNIFVT